ncbi:hypothetical protein D9757_004062 [Collybiopsis confluens]|uniref:Protein kinase domain-containing protein n=1 Tax=Collybiopsis confluens TaxID=2823264 RepID=A0A8H5HX94_9AGAR|nr:hypothetical protein D9757_004062 [Collybiopsis confluens]
MSLSWIHRKKRIQELLKSTGDENQDALALDSILHGQLVIGKTARTTEIDSLRFQDEDLQVLGTLEYGQFGVIDVVTCRLDSRVYVRKSIEKKFALRTREQCSPQFERDILLKALRTKTSWAPHLLCAYHTPTHLNIVMDYVEGGTLWDVLESSPLGGRISEDDLRWWAPQIASAINWCHTQGFVHRCAPTMSLQTTSSSSSLSDIKPHNFVITPSAHVQLIDFGSAAPLQPPGEDGSHLIPKQYCAVPCGTCDYISPEILKAHERALVALEIEDTQDPALADEDEEYGLETDWWSMGAMLYEMVYGVAPFFAEDIRRTYFKIMDHRRNLRFNINVPVTVEYQNFLQRLLTDAEFRLGRRNFAEITQHPFFDGVDWDNLVGQTQPLHLHLPQFTYVTPEVKANTSERHSEESSQPFAFSIFFQSSAATPSPGLSILHEKTSIKNRPLSETSSISANAFIGFSWGPVKNAFPDAHTGTPAEKGQPSLSGLSPNLQPNLNTPRPLRIPSAWLTPQTLSLPRNTRPVLSAAGDAHAFSTPVRSTDLPNTHYCTQTLPRTLGSTIRRTITRRAVSNREAMKQLVDCIGMSARKKVLESGRKPRILNGIGTRSSLSRSAGSTMRKELRFVPDTDVILPRFEHSSLQYQKESSGHSSGIGRFFGTNLDGLNGGYSDSGDGLTTGSDTEDTPTDIESEAPPSPSPSPRPGSAMSMSMMSKRSGTPTLTSTFSQRLSTPSLTSRSFHNLVVASGSAPRTRRNRSTSGESAGRTRHANREDEVPDDLDVEAEEVEAGTRETTRSAVSFENETLNEFDERYSAIMEDIAVLERRLDRFQRLVGQ